MGAPKKSVAFATRLSFLTGKFSMLVGNGVTNQIEGYNSLIFQR